MEGREWSFYRRVGAVNPLYYTSPTGQTYSSFSHSANVLHATPFIVNKNSVADRIGINITIAGTSTKVRLPIYDDSANVSPGNLIVDSGDIAIGVGFKEAVINTPLIAGKLYWLVYLTDGTATVSVATPASNLPAYLGYDPSIAMQGISAWNVAFPYAAYPGVFTAGGAFVIGGIPLVSVRFSS